MTGRAIPTRVLVLDFTNRRIYWSKVTEIVTPHPASGPASGTTFDLLVPKEELEDDARD